MRETESLFRFEAEIIKAEQTDDGEWVFEGLASLPGQDLEGEETAPNGLEIDYLLGRGLPPGSGGFVNYDHDSSKIVGVPLEGRITPQGFWLKWKALKTKFMTETVIPQMKALKEAGWPRRYGMSIEGVVKQRDPLNPHRILRAFIRNVALTPTPVHPGTFVDFAKSLTATSVVEFRPLDRRRVGIMNWAKTAVGIHTGEIKARDNNPYFRTDGRFRRDGDVAYFRDVHGMSEADAMFCARYALSREPVVMKALGGFGSLGRPRGHPHAVLREHLKAWKEEHPECPHVAEDGSFTGGPRMAARHFYGCEVRNGPEVNALLELLKGSGLLKEEAN